MSISSSKDVQSSAKIMTNFHTQLIHLTTTRPKPQKRHPPTKAVLFKDEADFEFQEFFPSTVRSRPTRTLNRKRDKTRNLIQSLVKEPLENFSFPSKQKRKKPKTKRERSARLSTRVKSMYSNYVSRSPRFKEDRIPRYEKGEPGSVLVNSPVQEGDVSTVSFKCPGGIKEEKKSKSSSLEVGMDSSSSSDEEEGQSDVVIPRSRRVKSLAQQLQQRIYVYSPLSNPQDSGNIEEAPCMNPGLNECATKVSRDTDQEDDSFQSAQVLSNGPMINPDYFDFGSVSAEESLLEKEDAKTLLAADSEEKVPGCIGHGSIENEITLNSSSSSILTDGENINSDVDANDKAVSHSQLWHESPKPLLSEKNVSECLRNGRSMNKLCQGNHNNPSGQRIIAPLMRVKSLDRTCVADGTSSDEDCSQEVKLRNPEGKIEGKNRNSCKRRISLYLAEKGKRFSSLTASAERKNRLESNQRSRKALSTMSFNNTPKDPGGFTLLDDPARKFLTSSDTTNKHDRTESLGEGKVSIRRKKVITKKSHKVAPPKPPRSRTKAKRLTECTLPKTQVERSTVSVPDIKRNLQGVSRRGSGEPRHPDTKNKQPILSGDNENFGGSKDLQPQNMHKKSRSHCEHIQNRSSILLNGIDEEIIVCDESKIPTTVNRSDNQKASTVVMDAENNATIAHEDRESTSTPKKPPRPSLASPKKSNLQEDQDLCESTSTPKKPPRPSIASAKKSNLQEDQDLCIEHEALLNLYCSKCRLVICEKCQESSHDFKTHKVLSTPDALSMLRTETVTLLRHYSLLRSMFMTLKGIYNRYANSNQSMKQITEEIFVSLRLDDEQYLSKVVEETEAMAEKAKNLNRMKEKVTEWEKHQHDWGHIVYLAMRCRLLANISAANDKVFIRLKGWILPTPWIHLSHLLQPYLSVDTDSTTLTPTRKGSFIKRKSKTSTPCMRGSTDSIAEMRGQDTKTFPHNSTSVLVHSLLPYIIFNPAVRYFMHINSNLNTDITLVMEPSEEHVHQYLSRQRYTATYSPGTLRRSGYEPSDDALTIVEKQMMMGGKQRSRLIASYIPPTTTGSTSTEPVLVKVGLPDIKVVSGGLGLAAAMGSLRRGDVIVDSDPNRGPSLSVVFTNIGEVSALRFGHIIHGLESFKYLIENEEKRRHEGMGIRAKIRATVKREEETTCEITFGLDI